MFLIEEDVFEYVDCELSAILSLLQCINWTKQKEGKHRPKMFLLRMNEFRVLFFMAIFLFQKSHWLEVQPICGGFCCWSYCCCCCCYWRYAAVSVCSGTRERCTQVNDQILCRCHFNVKTVFPGTYIGITNQNCFIFMIGMPIMVRRYFQFMGLLY